MVLMYTAPAPPFVSRKWIVANDHSRPVEIERNFPSRECARRTEFVDHRESKPRAIRAVAHKLRIVRVQPETIRRAVRRK